MVQYSTRRFHNMPIYSAAHGWVVGWRSKGAVKGERKVWGNCWVGRKRQLGETMIEVKELRDLRDQIETARREKKWKRK